MHRKAKCLSRYLNIAHKEKNSNREETKPERDQPEDCIVGVFLFHVNHRFAFSFSLILRSILWSTLFGPKGKGVVFTLVVCNMGS